MRIEYTAAILLSFAAASCSGDVPPPDVPTPTPTDIENMQGAVAVPLSPAQQAAADDAIDALEAACPGFAVQFVTSGQTIVDLAPPPQSGSGPKPAATNFTVAGTHDHDTIAVDFELLSGAALATALYHEYRHAANAQAAGTVKDPTDGSVIDNSSPVTAVTSLLAGQGAHLEIYADMMDKMCAISQNGSGGGAALSRIDCLAIKGGITIFKAGITLTKAAIDKSTNEALANGDIDQATADAVKGAAQKTYDSTIVPLCARLNMNWPCPP